MPVWRGLQVFTKHLARIAAVGGALGAALTLAAFPLEAQAVSDRNALEARVKANPADLEAQVLLAKGYLDAGDAVKALPHLKAAAALRPDAGPLVFQYGATQVETGDFEGGYETLLELARREPNEAATRAYLVRAASALGKAAEAREHLHALRTLVPRDGLFHAQLVEWTATGRVPEVALEQVAYTLRLPLENRAKARVLFLDGFARSRLGQTEAAMASLKSSIALDNSQPRTYALLLTLEGAASMRNIDTAMLKDAVRRFPTSVDLLLLTGLLNLENEEYQAVKEIAGRLEIVAPGSAEAMLLQGHVFLALNDYEDAARLFRQALARGMATPHLWHHLALAEQKAGRPAAALEAYAEALALDPGRAELLFDYAQLLHNLDRAAEAKPLAERMLALEPENPRAYKLMADVERKLGDREAAARHLAAFKRLSIARQATRRPAPQNGAEEKAAPTVPAP